MNHHLTTKFDPLMDGISLVQYIQHIGNDKMIVNAARVSNGVFTENQDITEQDVKLLKFLITSKPQHGSPFEHNLVTFNMKLPIFVARQMIRHRIGVSYSEVSRRYTSENVEFYFPTVYRKQSDKNKQASSEEIFDVKQSYMLKQELLDQSHNALNIYNKWIENGMAKEQARILLPLNLYTQWWVSFNFRSLLHFVSLRQIHKISKNSHPQNEISQYAKCMSEIMSLIFPISWSIAIDNLNSN